MPRLFDFDGSDTEYIKFLESRLLEVQRFSSPSSNFDLTVSPGAQHAKKASQKDSGIKFVIFNPNLHETRAPPQQPVLPSWKRQLNEFINSIPRDESWTTAREDAGIHTTERNRWAIQLMLGRTTDPVFLPRNHMETEYPIVGSADNEEMLRRACKYGSFISACASEGNFAQRVTEFQRLIFTSYCTVLLQAGNSKETVYSMMRHFINRNYDDKTLDCHRYGALWVNRCVSLLLRSGWGHRSWEIFLLLSRSPAQYGRFATNHSDSFQEVAASLGVQRVPIYEPGWIPYCLPCIVKSLAGNAIELSDICKCLGYDSSIIYSIHKIFFQSFDPFGYMSGETYVPQSMPLNPIQAVNDSMHI